MKATRVMQTLGLLLALITAVTLSTGRSLATPGACESLPGGPIEVESVANTTPTGYATLGAAFADINGGVYTGTITIDVCGDTTEAASAVLNASGSGSASYTAIALSPAGGAARTISGAIAGVLVDLNGADNVVFDGLNTGGNALTLDNTSAGATSATIRFIGDASSNTVQNCTIKGASAGTVSGTVVFGTGISTGNTGDTITASTITSSGANLPTNAIYSAGTSTSIANTGIAITNNNIQDWFNAAAASNGIFVASNSASWTITGNKLFQTATRNSTSAVTHRAINIVTGAGGGYTVSSNTVGYSSAAGTGTMAYTATAAALFRGIEMTVAASPASSIQGTTVTAISFGTTAATVSSVSTPGVFAGISVLAGSVNIGTGSANTVGSATATGAISVTSTVTGGVTDGIYTTSAGTINIQNNNVGGITAANTTTATIGFVVRAIDTFGVGGTVTTTGNTVGSTTVADSIQVGTTSVQTTAVTSFFGIANAATGTITITNNTIQNCTTNGTGADLWFGINNSGGTGTLNINGNSVIAGTSRVSAAATSDGIVTTAPAATVNLNNNTIRGMSWLGNNGAFRGIEQNNATITTAININDNHLGDASGGYISYAGANSGVLQGILNNAGSVTVALSIQRNDFRGISHAVASTHEIDCINVLGNSLTQTIADNTFTNLNVNTTGQTFLVRNQGSVAASGTQNVTNNAIVGTFNRAAASGNFFGFSNTGNGNATATLNQSNNNFSNVTLTGTSAGTCILTQDTAPRTIQGNVCSNWTGGAGGTLFGIRLQGFNSVTPAANVTSNTITNYSSAGVLNGIQVEGTKQGLTTVTSNTINGLTSSGGSVTGVIILQPANTGDTSTPTVTSNTISSLSTTGTTGGSVTGISLGSGIAQSGVLTTSASLNVVSGLSSTSTIAGGVNVIGIAGGASASAATVFRNRVYDLQITATAGTVTGMSAGSGTNNFYNNLVGDLRAPNASNASSPSVVGLTASGTAATVNYYDNTVRIAGTSSGSPFSTASVFAGAGPVLTLRNNALINASTPTGGGMAVGVWRTYVPLWNYSTSSNNNDIYASTAYYDGVTVAPTLSDMWAVVYPRESASFQENPPFVSTSGADPGFLHIVGGSTTLLESRGVNIAGITDDYDTDIRQGNPGYSGTGTAPDVGADEFGGLAVGDVQPPAIVYSPLGMGAVYTSRTLTATITDATGVASAIGLRPRAYFKKSTDANDLTGWKYVEGTNVGGSTYQFVIDYTMLNAGSVSVGDTIQYFVVAQDTVGTPNVGIFQGSFAAAPSSVALTSAAFPIGATINSYAIGTAVSGALTVCPSGCDYASLTNTGGLFEALNGRVFTGNVTVDLLGDSTAEAGTVALNQWPEDPAGNFTLTIRPGGGAARTVSGSVAAGLIRLNGADRVTIDGLNTGGNSLTINNTSAAQNSAAIHLFPTGVLDAGASSNTIRNLTIIGGANTLGVYGIAISGPSISSPAQDNDGNTITGNTITKVYWAIFARGAPNPPSAMMDNLVISNNVLGPAAQGADSLGLAGIYLYGANSPTVSGNTIRNLTAAATSAGGIYVVQEVTGGSIANNTITNLTSAISGGGSSSITGIFLGNLVTGMTISGNKIQGISNTFATGAGARGIIINSSELSAGVTTIANNVISDIASVAGTNNTTWPLGIDVELATNPVRVYHNSVNLFGAHTGANAASSSAALYFSSATSADVRDNVLVNSYDNSTVATDKAYAIYANNLQASAFSPIDNNDYYPNGPVPGNNFVGRLNSADVPSLAAWKTALGAPKDANSLAVDPSYTSATNLHLPSSSPMLGAGTPIAGISTDADGAARSLVKPTVGGYEIASADMSASVTDAPDPVSTGGTASYTITVTNSGPNAATSPAMATSTPPNTTFVSVSAPAGWSCSSPSVGGTGAVSCSASTSLGVGGSAVITLSVRPDYCLGSLPSPIVSTTDNATASSALPDVVAANNTGSESTAIADSGACNDGSVCTTADVCISGVCVGGSPLNCDDTNACTDDSCIPATGCAHTTHSCDDSDGCTIDGCNPSSGCFYNPKDCSDGNQCTPDACISPAGTCDNSGISGVCDINGSIYYYRNNVGPVEPSTKPIVGEDVTRLSSLEATQVSTSNSSGQFDFQDEAGEVSLTPNPVRVMTDESECHNSITAADAAEISKATVGIVTFTTNQRIAGDVSNNGTISSFDAALTAQKAVASPCLAYAFPVRTATGSDWAFRPVNRSYTPLTGIGEDYSFLGILYGDVTGNWVSPVLFGQSTDDKAQAPSLETTMADASVRIPTPVLVPSGTVNAQRANKGAVLFVIGSPIKNNDGTWSVVFGMQRADGILGLDMNLHLDSTAVSVVGVTTTGISSAWTVASHANGDNYQIALFGIEALQGTGAFLKVTYRMTSQVNGLPFAVAAQANEGQIPVSWSGVPRATQKPAINVDEQ